MSSQDLLPGDKAVPCDERIPPSKHDSILPLHSNPSHPSVTCSQGRSSITKTEPEPGIPDPERRYTPQSRNKGEYGDVEIPPGKQSLAFSPPPELDWEAFVHPEGNIFFCRMEPMKTGEIKVITDEYLPDNPKLADKILDLARGLISKAEVMLDGQTELVLNLDSRDASCWRYYFVDLVGRRLFWQGKVTLEKLSIDKFKGVTDLSQIEYLMEQYYWCHLEYYPHNRTLSISTLNELKGLLNYIKADLVISDTSLSPFTQDEVSSLLSLVESLKDDVNACNAYSCWVVARVMSKFAETRFVNFFGQKYARLDADMSIFEEDEQQRKTCEAYRAWKDATKSIFFSIVKIFVAVLFDILKFLYFKTQPLSLIVKLLLFDIVNLLSFELFNAHADRLRHVWIDHIIIQPRWKDFVTGTVNDLTRCTVFSTVMLAANFSFLAVPGVIPAADPTTDSTPPPTPSQILIYISALATIASVMLSVALLNVYSDPGMMCVDTAANAMRTVSKKMGMSSLAFTHSLPMVLLLWSILLFFLALAREILVTGQHVAIIVLATIFGLLVLMAAWSLTTLRVFSSGIRNDTSDAS